MSRRVRIVLIIVVVIIILFFAYSFFSYTNTNNYIGCYKDNPARDLPIKITSQGQEMSIEECRAAAKAKGYPYFGIQWAGGFGDPNKGECFAGPSYGKYGSATNCVPDSTGKMLGGTWSNAIYKV
ncbi:MAG: WSC domain-containing protein [Nitrososphaerota archaeon]